MPRPRKYTDEELAARNRDRAREAYRAKRAAEGHVVREYRKHSTTRRPRRHDRDALDIACGYIADQARARARRDAVACTITAEDVRRMWHEQRTACAITGVKMTFDRGHDVYRVAPTRVSVDRIDAGGDYVPNNVRLVCWWYNALRSQYGDEVMHPMLMAYAAQHSVLP